MSLVFLVKTFLKKSTTILSQLSDTETYVKLLWIIFLPDMNSRITKQNSRIPFNCDYFIIREADFGFVIRKIYQLKRASNMTVFELGRWKSTENIIIDTHKIFTQKINLKRRAFIMVTNDQTETDSYSKSISNFDSLKICRFAPECLNLEVWLDIGKMLNFT